MSRRVGIVGGGITGLALTHYLDEHGVEAVTFEARGEPGGVMRSRTVEGRVLELGPQRSRLTPSLQGLIETLGLEDDVIRADGDLPLYVYYDGRLRRVPLSPRTAITTDLLSWRGKARALLEPLTGPVREGETVGEFLTRKFGPECNDRFFGLLYASIYGSDPDEMLMEYSLGRALAKAGMDEGSVLFAVAKRALRGRSAPPIVSFADGLGTLPRALYEAHADRIRLDTAVRDLRPAGEGYELVTDADRIRVDEVVCTTPADVTADLLEGVTPETAAALRELNYNPLALVFLEADVDREGLGYQVHRDAGLRTDGVTWNAGMFDRDGVYTAYLGGAGDAELVEASDERLGAIAREEFATVMDADARVLDVHRWPRGMPAFDRSWTATDRIALPAGLRLATNYMGRAGIPGRLREANRLADALGGENGTEGRSRRATAPA